MIAKPPTCKGCSLETMGDGFAPGAGSAFSPLWLIGEALGREEAEQGIPFIGGAGRVLTALCAEAGIARNGVFITNTVRCRPPKNELYENNKALPYTLDAIEHCSTYMQGNFQTARPNCVVALGKTALNAFAPYEGVDWERGWLSIENYRGSILWSTHYNVKVVPTIHPAAIMRQQTLWAAVVADLVRARVESAFPERQLPAENFILDPTPSELHNFISELIVLRHPVGVDIETTIATPYTCALNLVGFGNIYKAMCVSFEDDSVIPLPIAVEEISRLLDSGVPLVFQNGNFDVTVLESLGFRVSNYAFDTMLAHQMCYGELPHNLGFITSTHTRVPFYKTMAQSQEDWEK